MSTISKVILITITVMLLATSAIIGFSNLKSSKDNTAMPEKSTTMLHGGYDAYDDTYISGTQVETALTIYGSVDRGEHGRVSGNASDGEVYIPYTESGLCYVQNGGSQARSKGKKAEDWINDPTCADHLVQYTGDNGNEWNDYDYYHNKKQESSYLNPEGLFHSTLVLGEDMADENLRLNYPNKVMYIKFTQVKQHDNSDVTGPSAPPEEIVPEPPSGTPDELSYIVCDKPVIWEGTYTADLLKRIVCAQDIKVWLCETVGVNSHKVAASDADWHFVDNTVTLRTADLSTTQDVNIIYNGRRAVMHFTVVQLLSVNGDATSFFRRTLHPDESISIDVNHFRTSRDGSGIEGVTYKAGTPTIIGEITDNNGRKITKDVIYNNQVLKSNVPASSFNNNLQMTVGKDVNGYKATRNLQLDLIWSNVNVGYFNHTAAYSYYVGKWGTDESHIEEYWAELESYCSYLKDVAATFKDEEKVARKRAWILGVAADPGWKERARDNTYYEIVGATNPEAPIISQIAEGDVVTFYSNVANMKIHALLGTNTGLKQLDTFVEGVTSEEVSKSSQISTFLTYKATQVSDYEIGFSFSDGNKITLFNNVDGISVTNLSVKPALCPTIDGNPFRTSSYNYVTASPISQTENDKIDDNIWSVDYVTNGVAALTINNGNNVTWNFRTDGQEHLGLWDDGGCFSNTSLGNSVTMSLSAALMLDSNSISSLSEDSKQGYQLARATYNDFGGRYTGEYTIYNWYPSVIVKRTYDGTNHVAQTGEPYAITVSQADADVTATSSNPRLDKVSVEELNSEDIAIEPWNTEIRPIWAKSTTITATRNLSLTLNALRKRTGENSAVSTSFVLKDTKLYTYQWYNGSEWSDSLRQDRLCSKGTKANTEEGTTSDTNRIAIGDKVMNASTQTDSTLDELKIKLYKSGSNSSNAPTTEPAGDLLATLEAGETENNYLTLSNKTLCVMGDSLSEQVYTLAVEGKKGSCTIFGKTFNWGAPTAYYYVYNLYGRGYDNVIKFTDSDIETGQRDDGSQYAIIGSATPEIYVQSYYSAIYNTSNFTPSDAYTFRKGSSSVSSYTRQIVNDKAKEYRDSNEKNARNNLNDTYNFLHVNLKSSVATPSGTNISVKVTHPEFANRTKTNMLKVYKKINNQSFNVLERHTEELTIKDVDGNKVSAGDLSNNYTLTFENASVYTANAAKTVYKINYAEHPKWKKSETDKDGNNKNLAQIKYGGRATTGNALLDSVTSVLSSGADVQPLTVTTRTFMSKGTHNEPCKLTFTLKGTDTKFTVSVNTTQFKAKLYGRYKDNYGFVEGESEGSSKDNEILVEQSSFFRGDKVAISSNSDDISINTGLDSTISYSINNGEQGFIPISDNVNVEKFFSNEKLEAKSKSKYVVEKDGDNLKSKFKEITYVPATINTTLDKITDSTSSNLDDRMLYAADGLFVSYAIVDEGVDTGFWEKVTSKVKAKTQVIDKLAVCVELNSSLVNRLWYYEAPDQASGIPRASLGEAVWAPTYGTANQYYTMVRSTGVLDRNRTEYVTSVTGDAVGNYRNLSLTVYDFLNVGTHVGSSRVAYAGRQIAAAELREVDPPKWKYGLPNTFAISPLGSKVEGNAQSDYLQAIGDSRIENDHVKFLADGIVTRNTETPGGTGSKVATPIALVNATSKRILCALSWKDNKAPGQIVGEEPETALANFNDAKGGNGSNMIYIHTPLSQGDGVVVTYSINGDKKQIIHFKDADNKQSGILKSTAVLDETNVFAMGSENTFVQAGKTLECKPMSGSNARSSALVVGNFSEFFDGVSFANGTSQGINGYNETLCAFGDSYSVIRLNADKLEWLESNVKYVDVDVTIIRSKFGYRQITFPYRFLVHAHQ